MLRAFFATSPAPDPAGLRAALASGADLGGGDRDDGDRYRYHGTLAALRAWADDARQKFPAAVPVANDLVARWVRRYGDREPKRPVRA